MIERTFALGQTVGHASNDAAQLFMLPKSEHNPAVRAKGCIYSSVPLNVFAELRSPIAYVPGGNASMFWAAVPEATIDENRQPRLREHDIRFGRKRGRQDTHVLSEPVAGSVQCRPEEDLRLRFGAPDCAHVAGASGARRLRKERGVRGGIHWSRRAGHAVSVWAMHSG